MKVKAARLAMIMRRAKVSLMFLAWELNMKQRDLVRVATQGAFDYEQSKRLLEIFGAEAMAQVIDWEGMNVRNPLI